MTRTANRFEHIFSFTLPILILILLQLSGLCIYESNDDMAMIRILSGQQGLTASPDAVFMALPLSSLLYLLYKITLSVPWYGLTMYGALVIGASISLLSIFRTQLILPSKIAITIGFLFFYSTMASRLNFASVALLLFFAASVRLTQEVSENHQSKLQDLYMGGLMAFSYLIRPDIITYIAPLFMLPSLTFFFISSQIKRILKAMIPLYLVIIISLLSAGVFRSTAEYHDFSEFNKTRAQFTDTSRSEFNMSTTISALVKTEWSMYDYKMAQMWWLHDDTIYSTSKIQTFLDINGSRTENIISLDNFSFYLKPLQIPLLITILCLSVSLFHNASPETRLHGRKRYLIIGALIVTLTAFMLLAAFRFPQRIALPIFSILILLCATFIPSLVPLFQRKSFIEICGKLILIVTIFLFLYLHAARLKSDLEIRYECFVKRFSTEQSLHLIQKNFEKDMIFLNTNPLGGGDFNSEFQNPLHEFNKMVSFINFPIGWMIASPIYNKFLRQYGFKNRQQMIPSLIANPKVILCFYDSYKLHWDQFSYYFENHLSPKYAHIFNAKKITPEIVLDRRANQEGWIFFRLLPN